MDWTGFKYCTQLVTGRTGGNLYLRKQLSRSRTSKSHHHNERTRNRNDDCEFKRVQPIAIKPVIASVLGLLLLPINVRADVGGVSATANPQATSSGSATVNAYQVLTGNFINSAFPNGVQCQSETVTLSPYVGRSRNTKRPFVHSYKDPVYDMRDLDSDGAPDNPGSILFEKDILTQQKDSFSLNYGLTLQWSKPLDSKLQSLCKLSASTEIDLRKADLNLKILDYEISRLKHCGTLKKAGISHIESSKYAKICEDIQVANYPSSVPQHSHKLNFKKGEAKEESVEKKQDNKDTEKQASASTSSEPSVLIDVHERKAPWASFLDD